MMGGFPGMMGGFPGGFPGMGGPAGGSGAQQPPRERFATQLGQLRDMGFTDEEAALRALQATGGNVQAAIDRLLSGL